MTVALTLRAAHGRQAQQAAIDAWLRQRRDARDGALAIVAEGAFTDLVVAPAIPFARLVAGCVCCVGALPLRVTLTRLLRRHRPCAVLLIVADATHLERVRAMLASGGLGVIPEDPT